MTPKLKAVQIILKMQFQKEPLSFEQGKKCALIAVDELIRVTPWGGDIDNEIEDGSKEFYIKVKQEIEKLCQYNTK